MNKNEIIIVSAVFGSAVIGYITKALVDYDTIAALKTDLKVANFKTRINRVAFETALEYVPSDRGPALTETIDFAMKFEQIAANNEE